VAAVGISGLALEAPAATSHARGQKLEGDEMLAERGSRSQDFAFALAIQRDGKLVAAGRSDRRFALARYNGPRQARPELRKRRQGEERLRRRVLQSGSWTRGRARREARGAGGDGETTYFGPYFALARYTTRGALDSSFGRGGKVLTDFGPPKRFDATGQAVALQSDGKVVVAGESSERRSPFPHVALARYTARGRLDPSFGRGGRVVTDHGIAEAVAIQRDGKIVTAGFGFPGLGLARYTPDGKLDPSFGNAGKTVVSDFGSGGYATAVAIQADGRIVAAGGVSGDFALARYTADGRLDPSFGDGGKVVTDFGPTQVNCPPCQPSASGASAVAVERDGKIVAAGASDVPSESGEKQCCLSDFALVRYKPDGSLTRASETGGRC
jgi:uncharacterized delta-60 repeat protein